MSWKSALGFSIALGSVTFADGPAPPNVSGLTSARDVVLTAASILPKGWRLLSDADARPEAEKALTTAAQGAAASAGLEHEGVVTLLRSLSGPGGKSATLAVVEADEKSDAVSAALREAAKSGGWEVAPLGTPSLTLLIAAPADARAPLIQAQVRWVAEGLCTRAAAVLETHDPQGALAVLAVGLGLDPKNARSNRLAGDVLWALAYLKHPPGPFDQAIARTRAALAPGTSYPLDEAARLDTKAQLGYLLLLVEGHEKESRDLLREVVSAPKAEAAPSYWNRVYNLACAHARLGEKDDAFRLLTTVLEQDARATVAFIEHWRQETDFKNLVDDPRWKALVERFPEDG